MSEIPFFRREILLLAWDPFCWREIPICQPDIPFVGRRSPIVSLISLSLAGDPYLVSSTRSLFSAWNPFCRREIPFVGRRSLFVGGRSPLSAGDPFCRWAIPFVVGQSLLLAGNPFCRREIPFVGGRYLLLVGDPFCQWVILFVRGRSLLSARDPFCWSHLCELFSLLTNAGRMLAALSILFLFVFCLWQVASCL
jgi:hypothetical protein